MNFPEYMRSIWTDPRFQSLDTPTRALLYGALSQVDIAGWWAPNPRLVAAEIPGVDLATAAVELQPWVQVHPTGWWSFKGYVALQVGEGGINLASGFHKGVARVLTLHLKREVSAGALPESIEGLRASATGALPTSNPEGNGGQPVPTPRAPGEHESPKSKVQCPQVPKSEVESPDRGPRGASETPKADHSFGDVLNVFQQMAPLAVLEVKPWDRDAVHAAAGRRGWEAVYRAAGAYFAHGPGPLPSLGDFIEKLPRLIVTVCPHTEKQWVTLPVDKEWPNGVHYKRWRCVACNHSEAHPDSEALPASHVHQYQRMDGSGIVLSDDGEMVSVPAWEKCNGVMGCGHSRAFKGVAA